MTKSCFESHAKSAAVGGLIPADYCTNVLGILGVKILNPKFYIIFAAFLSCGLELLRIPEFCRLALRLCFAASFEYENIKSDFQFDFEFGLHLAWTLVIFSVQAELEYYSTIFKVLRIIRTNLRHSVKTV